MGECEIDSFHAVVETGTFRGKTAVVAITIDLETFQEMLAKTKGN